MNRKLTEIGRSVLGTIYAILLLVGPWVLILTGETTGVNHDSGPSERQQQILDLASKIEDTLAEEARANCHNKYDWCGG